VALNQVLRHRAEDAGRQSVRRATWDHNPADLVRSGAMERRNVAIGLARGRIAIGVASLLAPGLVARTMTGRDASGGGTSLFASMVGARDFGLGLGLLRALDRSAPVRGWLEASALVDAIDVAACLLARDHIRTSVLPGAVGLAATGALLSAWLSRQLDPAPPAQSGHPSPQRPAVAQR
jgi:hypothetical protein